MAYHMKATGPIVSTRGSAEYYVSESHTEDVALEIACRHFAEDFGCKPSEVTAAVCCRGPNPEREGQPVVGCWNDWCILTECDGVHHVDVTGYAWTEPRGSVYDARVGEYVTAKDDQVVEDLDRGRYATQQVSEWICNDGELIEQARRAAREGVGAVAVHLTTVVRTASPYSAPWQVAQALEPDDYDRVDWRSVAADLLVG